MKIIKEEKGFVSIEAIMGAVLILMILLVCIGFYAHQVPKMNLEKDVQILAQKAKIQGGLTDVSSQSLNSDINQFLSNLNERGYDSNKVQISLKTKNGNRNAIGVTPMNKSGKNYVSRDSKDIMILEVKIPVKVDGLTGPLRYFGVNNNSKVYSFKESIMSERW